jgi:hypothetical protein
LATNNPNNRPLPPGVNNFLYAGVENAPRAVDRFWMTGSFGYSQALAAQQLEFYYADSEFDSSFGSTNTITESNLRPLYWNGSQ